MHPSTVSGVPGGANTAFATASTKGTGRSSCSTWTTGETRIGPETQDPRTTRVSLMLLPRRDSNSGRPVSPGRSSAGVEDLVQLRCECLRLPGPAGLAADEPAVVAGEDGRLLPESSGG